MRSEAGAPTGLARRGRRLSDRETELRMLRTAVAMVRRDGLTVSLDNISLEDVIRDADVSRSAVYRRWPYKDLFISDLVKELAKNATPEIVDGELELMRHILADHQDRLGTPELRHGLMAELFRQLALFDFETMYSSPGWRTYLALHATFLSLADGTLRDQVQEALAESERIQNARVARAWRELTAIFGYRLTARLGDHLRDTGHAARRHPERPDHQGPLHARTWPATECWRARSGPSPSRSGPCRRWAWGPSPRRSSSPTRRSSGTSSGSPASRRPCAPGSRAIPSRQAGHDKPGGRYSEGRGGGLRLHRGGSGG